MIYFGFFGLLEPTGTDLFSRASWVFFHTLRIGGVAMGILALWSLSGQRPVLMIDAVVSIAIGTVFALTGAAMLIDGGAPLQPALNVVFGWMFVSAGRRNWSDYYALAKRAEFPEHTARPMTSPPHTPTPPPQPVDDPAAAVVSVPLAIEEIKPATPEPHGPTTPELETEPAPGGFLESFADEGPPPAP